MNFIKEVLELNVFGIDCIDPPRLTLTSNKSCMCAYCILLSFNVWSRENKSPQERELMLSRLLVDVNGPFPP